MDETSQTRNPNPSCRFNIEWAELEVTHKHLNNQMSVQSVMANLKHTLLMLNIDLQNGKHSARWLR